MTSKKRPLPGMHHTEVRSGDAPKPSFSFKTNKKLKTSESQDSINHPYFWVWYVFWVSVCAVCSLRYVSFWSQDMQLDQAGQVETLQPLWNLHSKIRPPLHLVKVKIMEAKAQCAILVFRSPDPDFRFLKFSLVFNENDGFGASPLWDSVWCIPAEGFFFM